MPAATDVDAGAEAFGLDLYAQLAKAGGNLVCSPLSVRLVLALAASGAGGDTRAELRSALRLPADAGAVGGLATDLNAAGDCLLAVTSAVWAERGFPLSTEFVRRARAGYFTEARACDFAADPAGSRATINRWVESATGGRIRDLVPAGAIDAETRLVLTNAVYFRAEWVHEFPESRTKPGPFTLAGGATERVPLMHLGAELRASDDPAEPFRAVRLPYRGGTSMLLLVPRAPDGLPLVEARLSAGHFAATVTGLTTYRVELTLPRFGAEFAADLAGPLRALGINRAFDPASADFSGVTPHPDGLFVSHVAHKAFIRVDERGTEAAAATGGGMGGGRGRLPPPAPPLTIIADRPFVYAICHDGTGRALFWGRCATPA